MLERQHFDPQQPIVVACGMGVNMMAMFIEMHRRAIRPDLLLFADTGAEKTSTYLYVPIFRQWCRDVDFPELVVVRYQTLTSTPYDTLTGNCLANETLPGIAFGMKSCSIKWKRDPQDRFCNHWGPAKAAWDAGARVNKIIGFDATPRDQRRAKATFAKGKAEDPKYGYTYPLQQWGIDRDHCKRIIADEGLPVPKKSACFYCLSMKPAEIARNKRDNPAQHAIALQMERRFREGKHYRGEGGTQGLGRRFAWADLNLDEVACDGD